MRVVSPVLAVLAAEGDAGGKRHANGWFSYKLAMVGGVSGYHTTHSFALALNVVLPNPLLVCKEYPIRVHSTRPFFPRREAALKHVPNDASVRISLVIAG